MWRMKISFFSWPVLHAGKQTTEKLVPKAKRQTLETFFSLSIHLNGEKIN
jgi:hypothetical protein